MGLLHLTRPGYLSGTDHRDSDWLVHLKSPPLLIYRNEKLPI